MPRRVTCLLHHISGANSTAMLVSCIHKTTCSALGGNLRKVYYLRAHGKDVFAKLLNFRAHSIRCHFYTYSIPTGPMKCACTSPTATDQVTSNVIKHKLQNPHIRMQKIHPPLAQLISCAAAQCWHEQTRPAYAPYSSSPTHRFGPRPRQSSPKPLVVHTPSCR